jgi:3-methyladenine DNA glycosylase/8-oxoguanine DNA glycosylase
MAKLPRETSETIWSLKRQALEIVEEATAAEAAIFELFGETGTTVPFMDEMKSVAQEAASSFSQLSNLQLRIAETQTTASYDMLELLARVIARTQARIPAWERSIQEVKIEWNLP